MIHVCLVALALSGAICEELIQDDPLPAERAQGYPPPPGVLMPVPSSPYGYGNWQQCPPGSYCYDQFRVYGGHPQEREGGQRMCRNVYGYVVPCDSLRGPPLPR